MFLHARDISNAWYNSVRHVLHYGFNYIVERGSFEGHERRQLPFFALKIAHPESRPLGVTHLNNVISTDDAIANYYTQLITSDKHQNEAYKYGERIAPHLTAIVEMRSQTPNTNQATIEVGRPEDVYLTDPPCLRFVSWKKVAGRLQLTVFFRIYEI